MSVPSFRAFNVKANLMNGSERGKFSNDQEASAMSSKAKPYIIGAALGASTMFFALQYHVVHSHDGFQIIPRTPQQSLGLAYADIRSWSPSQWTDRPELARALMAHGSSDLISDSVASTLSDSVSEDAQGLDELRSFLNETRSKIESSAEEMLTIPRGDDSADASSKRSGSSDVVGIPFPKDAKAKPASDPFRPPTQDDEPTVPGTMANSGKTTDIAVRSEIPAKNSQKSATGSRFSADDVINGFEESEPVRPPKPSSLSRRTPSSTDSSVLEQGKKAAQSIFGSDGSTSTPSSTRSGITKPSAKSPDPSEAESMFEEVTSQLENRAQDALNRAQDATKTRVSAAIEDASKSGSSFIRNKVEEVVPDAAQNLLNNNSSSTSTENAAETFDPFLE